jgi:hypothetical protein
VTVHRVTVGWEASKVDRYDTGHVDSVTWAGSGGYWKEAAISDVQIVDVSGSPVEA